MSISRQNLSIVIVTFKSEVVIHECIKSIDKDIKIIVIENSNNTQFKNELEATYKNVSCFLSYDNLGMGSGNNLGIKKTKTDFVLILNPDVILENTTINELIIASEKISDFAIIAPISSDINYPNYKLDNNQTIVIKNESSIKVKSVDGFAMLFNKKKLDKVIQEDYFDENFFMYLENDDLCKRIVEAKEYIYIAPNSKIKHLGGEAVNSKFKNEVEFARNWHWVWSKFYFNKKHYGYSIAFLKGFPKFFTSLVKYIFYSLINNKIKKKNCLNRISGFFNAAVNKRSWYRSKF
jgi:N-acetylglucosaminyl-diphospho-decaprenol L-rhamnosyltransferase